MLKDNVKEYQRRLQYYEVLLNKREERWKRIYFAGEETIYSISSKGRLKNTKTGVIMSAKHFNSNGDVIDHYLRVTLIIHGMIKRYQLHRLVAEYFCVIPKRHKENGLTFKQLVVNHKNGIKTCNASFNLEWVTHKENMDHAFKTELCTGVFGEKSHLSKITEKQAIQICELISKGKTNDEIVKELGVTRKTVQHIRSRECWKKVSKNYTFPKLADAKPYTLDESKIREMCKVLELKKYSDVEIAKMFNMKREYVRDVRLHKLRKDISKDYNF